MNIPIRLTPTGDGLRKLLGPLEVEIMNIIWTGRRPYTVRQVHQQILTQRDLAYTTVQTTMVRLTEKGILSQEPIASTRGRGGTYIYTAVVNEAAFVDHAITEVIQSLLRDYPAQVRRAIGVRHGHAI